MILSYWSLYWNQILLLRCAERGVRLKRGVNKKTGKDVLSQVAIVKTRDLKIRYLENYLDPSYYYNRVPDPHNILLKYCRKTEQKFDIISSVPIDPMHTIFQCALNWLIGETWIKGKTCKKGKFSKTHMASIESKLKKVKGCLPYAIEANIGFKEFEKFKVTWSSAERRAFLIYVAIVVLNDPLMDPEAYKILLSLQHAIMLIAGNKHMSRIPPAHLRKAQQHLTFVVERCQRLYGPDFPRYTFHCLLHIVPDLEANNCRLDYCSMFRYENSMKFFIHVLDRRGGHRVHAQIRNSLLRKKHSSVVLPPL